nr:MAG TPA: hypothetical protein [Inoviridae sp.]
MKAKEVHRRTALGVAPFRERQPPFLRLKKKEPAVLAYVI